MAVLPQILQAGSHALTSTKGRRETLKLQKARRLPTIATNTRMLKLHVHIRLEGVTGIDVLELGDV